MKRYGTGGSWRRAWLFATILGLLAWSDGSAQTTTGIIRGQVTNDTGQPVVSADVVATNVDNGTQRRATTTQTGQYVLPGLQPGTYEIAVEMLGFNAEPRTVRVLIGQSLTVDLQLSPQALELEGITVIGNRVVETRTSEVATNVTQEQIESLPQQDRNFLNFAGLAPGVTVSRDETNKNITAGGLPASKINVFIDGASFKNDVLEGGVHGQDASRGNPFPQIAIQEFRVITQNFKAEYQRAASAVVTATTKSGTNDFQFDGFVLGQNKEFVAFDPGARLVCDRLQDDNPSADCAPKPEYERFQLGLSAGGPIIQDRLHYFGAYEANIQNRQAQVTVGRDEFRDQFQQYEGTFDQPFRSHLGVAKLSYAPGINQTLDLSWNGRFESDKRGFGGNTSFESAEDVRISYNVLTLQHGITHGDWFNQAHISAQRSTWNPTAINDDQDIGLEYEGVIRIGARGTEQKFVQDRIALRNDLTRFGIELAGNHVFKGGVNVDFLNYDVQKRLDGNPVFFFNPSVSMTVPTRAFWGSGDPGMDESNVQFGGYIQDDWDVTPRLQLNLGVRWDAETNMFNNKWVTPDSIRSRIAPTLTTLGYDPDAYFTSGSDDRPIFLGAFQPRVGFSYDLLGTGRTVLHGGIGVYYDREIWNHLLDERHRLEWVKRNFEFTGTGEAGKIPWQSQYLSRAGLQSLVDQVNPFVTAEIFLLKNDSKPPRSNQFNVGVRQTVRNIVLGATYRGVRAENLTSWYCAKAHSEHGFCEGTREMGLPYNLLLSTDEGRTWYDAFDLTVEKPYTSDSRWGFTFCYTFQDSERKGQDFFTLDFPDVRPENWPTIPSRVEDHHIVGSGIVGLPYQFKLSTLVQWGTGLPFSRRDETIGWGPRRVQVDWFSEDTPNFRQVDMRLQKDFMMPQGRVGLIVEAINVFDWDNFRGYEELSNFGGGEVNDNFALPQTWTADTGRRLQIGLDFGVARR